MMAAKNAAVREQVVKTVVRSGNGGAVWVPKSWLGQEVVVILPEKPRLEVKERVIHLLEPYLKDIISVGIYGSYARDEQTKDSDIDVLVITKDKKLRLNFKKEKIEAISFPIGKLREAIQKHPIVYYQMVQEIKPLISAYVLEELKSIKVTNQNFKGYLQETKEHLKSNLEFVNLDKLDDTYLKSFSVLYSAILRLRGLFILRCILMKDDFSNKKFKAWLISRGLSPRELDDAYQAYRLIRDGEGDKKLKVRISVAAKVLSILGKELAELEAKIHGKQKEEA